MKAMMEAMANLFLYFFAFIGVLLFFDALRADGLGQDPLPYYRIVIAGVVAILMVAARHSERRKAQRAAARGAA